MIAVLQFLALYLAVVAVLKLGVLLVEYFKPEA